MAKLQSSPSADNLHGGNFCKALKGVSSPLKVHRVQWKIESNQPVKIEIPHLLHDLIWFEVASFGSPSNKMNCLFFQGCYLHLCLRFSASSSSFCGLPLSGSWLWKLPNHSLALATMNKRKAVLIASLLFTSSTSLSILFLYSPFPVSLFPLWLLGFYEDLLKKHFLIKGESTVSEFCMLFGQHCDVLRTEENSGKFMFK